MTGGDLARRQDRKRVCVFSQQQTNKETGQLRSPIERTGPASRLCGGHAHPAVLAWLCRVRFTDINNAPIGTPLLVRTCLPVGCLAGVSLDAAVIASLKKAQALAVRATVDGGQGAVFTISLNGFSNALDRTAALAQ